MQCPLCHNTFHFKTIETRTKFQGNFKKKIYHQCLKCHLIFLDDLFKLSAEEEKKRYLLHQSSSSDKGYQDFVSDIMTYVMEHFTNTSLGLDYGSGNNSVLSKLFQEKKYTTDIYDPFFANNYPSLIYGYDYIIACEVIEHFYNPHQEFLRLKKLLKKNAPLILKTELYDQNTNFENWYYRLDPTHVCFYCIKTLQWITYQMGFKTIIKVSDRTFALWKV